MNFYKFILSASVLVIGYSALLLIVRFKGPEIGFCETRGRGSSTRTLCLGVVEFKGDDVKSIYRIRLQEWRNK